MKGSTLTRFLDGQGLVTQWPTKRRDKDQVLAYLAGKFEFGKDYNESQVNELLKQWHTFNDWPLLRRELFEGGYLDRVNDGSRYWRLDKSEDQEAK
jgi:hypothetical protein